MQVRLTSLQVPNTSHLHDNHHFTDGNNIVQKGGKAGIVLAVMDYIPQANFLNPALNIKKNINSEHQTSVC